LIQEKGKFIRRKRFQSEQVAEAVSQTILRSRRVGTSSSVVSDKISTLMRRCDRPAPHDLRGQSRAGELR
jgi:hypothetical protein